MDECYLLASCEGNNDNNNNNAQDDIYNVVIYSAKRAFTLGPLSRRSAPGGRHLVGQAANLIFGSTRIGCYRPNIRPWPFVLLLNLKVDTHLPSLVIAVS